jgi:hypothetical protein
VLPLTNNSYESNVEQVISCDIHLPLKYVHLGHLLLLGVVHDKDQTGTWVHVMAWCKVTGSRGGLYIALHAVWTASRASSKSWLDPLTSELFHVRLGTREGRIAWSGEGVTHGRDVQTWSFKWPDVPAFVPHVSIVHAGTWVPGLQQMRAEEVQQCSESMALHVMTSVAFVQLLVWSSVGRSSNWTR